MHLSKNTSEPSESLRGKISLGSTIPFFRLPRMPDGEGHCSSVMAIGLCGLRMVSLRSGGGRLSCCRALLSVLANKPRLFSALPMSSPDKARLAGRPRASRTSRSLAVRNELRCVRTEVQLAGRLGDVSLLGRRLSIERAVSTRVAHKYCPVVTFVWAISHSSWLELEVPLRENILALETKLLSLYWAVDMLEVFVSADSDETCWRTNPSSNDCTTRAFNEPNVARFGRRFFRSSSSSSILKFFICHLNHKRHYLIHHYISLNKFYCLFKFLLIRL